MYKAAGVATNRLVSDRSVLQEEQFSEVSVPFDCIFQPNMGCTQSLISDQFTLTP